jgi:hypothetical protein
VTAPSVTFRPSSGIREIEPNVDYAVALTRMFLDNEAFRRPLKATWVHGMALVIEDPMAPKDQMRVGGFDAEVVVLGRWNDPMEKGPLGDGCSPTPGTRQLRACSATSYCYSGCFGVGSS